MIWLDKKRKSDFEASYKMKETAEEEARSKRVKAIESDVKVGKWMRRVQDEEEDKRNAAREAELQKYQEEQAK